MTEKLHSRAAGLITFEVGVALKTEWVEWCKKRDLVSGKVLKSMVEKVLNEGFDFPVVGRGKKIQVVVAKARDTGSKVGREIQFTPSENAAIEAVAKAQRFGFQEWVVAAVRAALAESPSYGQAELDTLAQSNLRLSQLVVELGGVRRSGVHAELAADMARLEGEIREHVETVSVAISKGAQRWRLKV